MVYTSAAKCGFSGWWLKNHFFSQVVEIPSFLYKIWEKIVLNCSRWLWNSVKYLLSFMLQAVEFVEASIDHINAHSKELRRLFLVEDIVDSIKVCVLFS